MDQVFPPHIGIVLLAVLVTAATDLWKYKVYNVVTLPLLACGLIYHSVVGGSAAATGSVLGAAFGFSALFVFYLLGGMGAGDVKLMSAVGLQRLHRRFPGRRSLRAGRHPLVSAAGGDLGEPENCLAARPRPLSPSGNGG